jgi:hypothetical protein
MLTRHAASLSIVLAATVGIGLAGCGGDADTVIRGGGSSSETTRGVDSTEIDGLTDEQIVARAIEAGTDLGDPNPTGIEWTFSTQAEAARLASNDDLSPSPTADTRAIVIQARGSFTVTGEPGLAPDESGTAVPPPTGSAFVLIIDASSGSFLGINVRPQPIDLNELGPVMRAPSDG